MKKNLSTNFGQSKRRLLAPSAFRLSGGRIAVLLVRTPGGEGFSTDIFSMRQCAQQTPQQWLGRAEEDGPEVGYIEKEGCFAPKDKEGGRGDPMENYREGASVRPSFFP